MSAHALRSGQLCSERGFCDHNKMASAIFISLDPDLCLYCVKVAFLQANRVGFGRISTSNILWSQSSRNWQELFFKLYYYINYNQSQYILNTTVISCPVKFVDPLDGFQANWVELRGYCSRDPAKSHSICLKQGEWVQTQNFHFTKTCQLYVPPAMPEGSAHTSLWTIILIRIWTYPFIVYLISIEALSV